MRSKLYHPLAYLAHSFRTGVSEARLFPIRHTTAMHLLQSGVDITVIALWLGHESTQTTHMYVEADLAMKERALALFESPRTKGSRYRPSDKLLKFLESL